MYGPGIPYRGRLIWLLRNASPSSCARVVEGLHNCVWRYENRRDSLSGSPTPTRQQLSTRPLWRDRKRFIPNHATTDHLGRVPLSRGCNVGRLPHLLCHFLFHFLCRGSALCVPAIHPYPSGSTNASCFSSQETPIAQRTAPIADPAVAAENHLRHRAGIDGRLASPPNGA